jgi:hypothetical protein
MVELPFSITGLLVFLNLEEENITGTSGNKGRVIDKIHLSQVHLGHSIVGVVLDVLSIDDEGLSLSVEAIDLISLIIVEALVWEVLLGAGHNHGNYLALDLLGLQVVEEVIMGAGGIVEQLHVDSIVGHEAAVDERIRECLDTHSVVVEIQ